MENDSNSKSSPSLSEDSFVDASSRRTIALDLVESTPAPAHFRAQPSATGAGEYSWAARVAKLTLRLDKLQLRVEALEDGFADPDDPTKEELDKLAPLQRARPGVFACRIARCQGATLRSLEQGGFSEARSSRGSSLRHHGGEDFCGTQVPSVPLRRGSSSLHP